VKANRVQGKNAVTGRVCEEQKTEMAFRELKNKSARGTDISKDPNRKDTDE
jgi:hypothetical protein